MDAAPPARLYLDVLTTPVRSLPAKGFAVLIGLVAGVNLLVGAMFLRMGAAPVPIFLGLDVLAVCLAFWASYRQARRRERVQVSAEQVRVIHENGSVVRTLWASPTAFTRVVLELNPRYGAQVRLRLSGSGHTIGQRLGPAERAELAQAVEQAIRAARAERYD